MMEEESTVRNKLPALVFTAAVQVWHRDLQRTLLYCQILPSQNKHYPPQTISEWNVNPVVMSE